MNYLNLKSKSIGLLLALLIIVRDGAAQGLPPTAGTPPSDGGGDSNFPTVLYPAIGAVVVGSAYYLLKKRPSSIPATQHLDVFLLDNNILPTPDAYDLVYALNPTIRGLNPIPSKYKITKPQFPELPKSVSQTEGSSGAAQSASLQQQASTIQSSIANFRNAKITVENAQLDQNSLATYLDNTNKELSAYIEQKNSNNRVMEKFLTDLLTVLNQTLNRAASTGTLNEKEATSIKDITNNINELLNPMDTFDGAEKQGRLNLKTIGRFAKSLFTYSPTSSGYSTYFQRTKINSKLYAPPAKSKRARPDRVYQVKDFAFAIFKLDSNGNPITKGPEVQKKYNVQYACPALKDSPNAYTPIDESATYAFESLPAARFALIVTDRNGKPVKLQREIVDTRKAFSDKHRKFVDKYIIIPLHIL
jgi:primosomal protein N''